MDWSNQYKSRVVSADEAVEVIQSGNRLFMTGNVSVPQQLLAALVKRAPEVHDVEICQALSVGPADYVSQAVEGHLRVNTRSPGKFWRTMTKIQLACSVRERTRSTGFASSATTCTKASTACCAHVCAPAIP